MRLDKYISLHTAATRSLAKMAIKSGRVTVNGNVLKDQGRKVLSTDEVCVNGEVISDQGEAYFVYHKPAGVICATEDEEQETVLDMVDGLSHKKLHIAGRLDKDTTGVVLLTSDGQWSHRVTSPKHECAKVYRVKTVDPIHHSLVTQFQEGLLLRDSSKLTLPAKLEVLGNHEAVLTLTEGRYHQVKRMFGACGNKVASLQRLKVGCIDLGDLEEGGVRELTEKEVQSFL